MRACQSHSLHWWPPKRSAEEARATLLPRSAAQPYLIFSTGRSGNALPWAAADLRSDRRPRGRADDQPARADRRGAQLGLPGCGSATRPSASTRCGGWGFTSEAGAFMHFMLRYATAREQSASGPLQVRYGIDGRTELPERELGHLAGNRAVPVRIGNAAAKQLQLGVYGELMGLGLPLRRLVRPISSAQWDAITAPDRLGLRLLGSARRGHRGDPRRPPEVPVLAADVLGGDPAGDPAGPARRPGMLAKARDAIYRRIMNRGWSPRLTAFAQYHGAGVLDAAVLMMPLVKFISPAGPK